MPTSPPALPNPTRPSAIHPPHSYSSGPSPRLLTLPETAAALAISTRSLHRLIAGGAFPRPLRIGRSSRVLPDDLSEFVRRLRTAPSESAGRERRHDSAAG